MGFPKLKVATSVANWCLFKGARYGRGDPRRLPLLVIMRIAELFE